jgi:hypothetical protein
MQKKIGKCMVRHDSISSVPAAIFDANAWYAYFYPRHQIHLNTTNRQYEKTFFVRISHMVLRSPASNSDPAPNKHITIGGYDDQNAVTWTDDIETTLTSDVNA